MTNDSTSSAPRPLVRHEHDHSTGLHRIILDRPEARNAISRQLLRELDAALDAVADACAAPSPTLAALAWKQAHLSLGQDAAAAGTVDLTSGSTASLEWPTPPMSRRASLTESSSTSNRSHSHDSNTRSLTSSRSSVSGPSNAVQPARCLILQSSSAKAFCAGADLAERRTMSPEEVVAFLAGMRRVMDKLDNMAIPTIAAIDGPALGGGLELALACDFRTAALVPLHPSTGSDQSCDAAPLRPLIGFPECQLGIIPGAGGTQRATRLLGISRAKSLIFTGKLLTACEANEWGLVEFLCDGQGQSAVQKAEQIAAQMHRSAPLALAAAKAAIDVGQEMDVQRGLDWEAACYQALLPTHDRQEALSAFAEKRKPLFLGK